RDLELAVVDGGRTGREVRMRARAVGCGPGTGVQRCDRDPQSGRWLQPVADRQLKTERIAKATVQHMRKGELAGCEARGSSVVCRRGSGAAAGRPGSRFPVRPAGQSVDGIAPRWLVQVELVAGAVEIVLAAVDPVGPGQQELASATGWQLIGLVPGDRLPAPVGQLA